MFYRLLIGLLNSFDVLLHFPYSRMNNPVLCQWMTLLDSYTRNCVPIIYLAIPGTNNSMSYSIRWNSCLAPDSSIAKRLLSVLTARVSIDRYKAQNYNAYEQMENGIRYFDLQICKRFKTKTPIKGFYFCHGRYCEPISVPLKAIKKYLDSHPKEFVIFDFRNFYAMNRADHSVVQDFLFDLFGNAIYGPNNGFLVDLTLSKALIAKKQVLIIYRDSNCWDNAWPDCCWPLSFVDIKSIEDLCNALVTKLKRRQPGIGYVSKCVFEPKLKENFSRSCTALEVFTRIKDWIPKQTAGFVSLNAPRINVVTADFVDINDATFCKEIVKLNDWSLYSMHGEDETYA